MVNVSSGDGVLSGRKNKPTTKLVERVRGVKERIYRKLELAHRPNSRMLGSWNFRPHYEIFRDRQAHRKNVGVMVLVFVCLLVESILIFPAQSRVFQEWLPAWLLLPSSLKSFDWGLYLAIAFLLGFLGNLNSEDFVPNDRPKRWKNRLPILLIYTCVTIVIGLMSWIYLGFLEYYPFPDAYSESSATILYTSIGLLALVIIGVLYFWAGKFVLKQWTALRTVDRETFKLFVNLLVVYPRDGMARITSATQYDTDGVSTDTDFSIPQPQEMANVLLWVQHMTEISMRPIHVSEFNKTESGDIQDVTIQPESSIWFWLRENRSRLAVLVPSLSFLFSVFCFRSWLWRELGICRLGLRILCNFGCLVHIPFNSHMD